MRRRNAHRGHPGPGAFTKVVLHDGTDMSEVAHVGRHLPAELRTAILERDGYTCVRP